MTSNIASMTGDLKDAVSPFEEVSQKFGVVVEQLSSVGDSIKATHAEIGTLGGNLATTADTMRAAWEAHRDRFDGVDKILEGVVEQLATVADSYQEHMIKFVKEIDQELNKSIKLLSSGIYQHGETVEDMGELPKNQKAPGASQIQSPPDR